MKTCLALIACLSLAATAAEPDTLKAACAGLFETGVALPANITPAETPLIRANFTNMTPENSCKPQPTQPREGEFTWAQADAQVAYAQANGLRFNGHALVWHGCCPDWFFLDQGKPAGRELVLDRMRRHVKAVAGRFRGKVASWDVVNEALADGPGEFCQNPWFKAIGGDYVAEAFRAAREADPQAELYYNDYSIEMPGKREKALRLIRELKSRRLRLDGIGIQGHWTLDEVPFREIEEAVVAFHAEGIKVMITELDLDMVPRQTSGASVAAKESTTNDPYATGCPPEVLQRQADQYARLFALFRKHSDKITRVTFWGLHDGRSWLNQWPRPRTNHPLLWDRQLHPKPALAAVLAALREPTAKPPLTP